MGTPSHPYNSPLFYESRASPFQIQIILFDSAPVVCKLVQSDCADLECVPSEDKDKPTYLYFKERDYVVPMRLITMSATQCQVSVSTHTLEGNVQGLADPERIVKVAKQVMVNSLPFNDSKAAGDYVFLSCIGKHVSVLVKHGSNVLQPHSYSGTWLPFYKQDDLNIKKDMPAVSVYGEGWTNTNISCESCSDKCIYPPAQTAPFACRPIGTSTEDQNLFRAMANVISGLAATPVVGETSDNLQTNIPFYRYPAKWSSCT